VAEPALTQKLGSLLLVATEPLTAARLAEAASANLTEVKTALSSLRDALHPAGLDITELDGKFRLVSSPVSGPIVLKFLQEEGKSDLTRPALETLAIVAYRGPVTKGQIEQIRGVASETMLRNLLARGLITEAGKSSEPGRPMRYAISQSFLEHFGLSSPGDLPSVPEAGHAD
jgi:segregation and condensation protein B